MGLNKPQSEAPTDKPRPEAAATAPQRTYIQTETHEWTPFELDAVLALVCRHRHRQPLLTFATELNEALNGANRNFDDDIPTADVSQFLEHLQKTRKYAFYFIERQARPGRITRAQRRVFERELPFTGTKKEWVLEGRREAEAAAKPARVSRLLARQAEEAEDKKKRAPLEKSVREWY